MILFIGQIGSDVVEREAFQEVDYCRMYGQMAKWVGAGRPRRPHSRIREPAFHLAVSGRPGQSCWRCPEDMLISRAVAAQTRPYHRVKPHASPQALGEATRLLQTAAKPLSFLAEAIGPYRHATTFVRSRKTEYPGRLLVPAPGPARQPPSQLCRRDRHRNQSGAEVSACARRT